jgi:hypothetical protein
MGAFFSAFIQSKTLQLFKFEAKTLRSFQPFWEQNVHQKMAVQEEKRHGQS